MGSATLEQRQMIITEETVKNVRDMKLSGILSVRILREGGESVPVSKDVEAVLLQALQSIAESGEFAVSRIPEELSSTTAAEYLGISRPTLMKWAKEGKIPSYKVKSHTRFRRDALTEFKVQRVKERTKAFDELRKFNEQHDDVFDD